MSSEKTKSQQSKSQKSKSSLAQIAVHPKYDTGSLFGLLKLLRNLCSHRLDINRYSNVIAFLLLDSPADERARAMMDYFSKVFPGLVTATYNYACNRSAYNVIRPTRPIKMIDCVMQEETLLKSEFNGEQFEVDMVYK